MADRLRTLYDKLWDAHVVIQKEDDYALIYIDRQLLHEVTSPQAFDGLRMASRPLWRVNSHWAMVDHNVPTQRREFPEEIEATSQIQMQTLSENCNNFGVSHFGLMDARQGIVHVVGPELGITFPGVTVVCGDSHTSTHGAFAALALGIGTSDVEHVMSTQTLWMRKARNMRVRFEGDLAPGVGAKDLVLALIGEIGTAAGTGCAIEFSGSAVQSLSVEGRMTLCNMAIEAGARSGLVAVDQTTIDYFKQRLYAPKGEMWDAAEQYWRTLQTDSGAVFDHEYCIDVSNLVPQITWGTSPEMVTDVTGQVPNPAVVEDEKTQDGMQRAMTYMGIEPGMKMADLVFDKVFIGSCTNSRIEDLRAAAKIVKGKKKSPELKSVLIVPGSQKVKQQAEAEGLKDIFIEAGFSWREPGCSMCLGMNADQLQPGERCASTSNRNFEGRQGAGGRTHLVGPMTAAAIAVYGRCVDVRQLF